MRSCAVVPRSPSRSATEYVPGGTSTTKVPSEVRFKSRSKALPLARSVLLMRPACHPKPVAAVYAAPTDGSAPPVRLTNAPENTTLVSWTLDSRAVLVQHEVDHLDGILFVDKATSITRGLWPV